MKNTDQTSINAFDKPDQHIDRWQALLAALEIGRHLQTVERQIRPQLLAQIENAGKRFAAIESTAEAGNLILAMCASWRGDINFPNVWSPRTSRDIERILVDSPNKG